MTSHRKLAIAAIAVLSGMLVGPSVALSQSFKTLVYFNFSDGASPSGLVQGLDGNFYGTSSGGTNFDGTVFKVTPEGAVTTLHNFCTGTCTDGFDPLAALVLGTDGNFYGTTEAGGANLQGTIFKITPAGTLTTLYNFCAQTNCADGELAIGALVQANGGNFYGTTFSGGVSNALCGGGCGTVFKMTPSGMLTTLYDFCSQANCADGSNPYTGLIQATDGNLYGTTQVGGTSGAGYGTVFRITTAGTFASLYSFCAQTGCVDGAYPEGGLLQAADGNLYGTTAGGGEHYGNPYICDDGLGCGTIFSLTLAGNLTTIHDFCLRKGCPDGNYPAASLIQGTDGDLYGTTVNGGLNDCIYGYATCGTVFKVTTTGNLTILHQFDFSDGGESSDSLLQATTGQFYGGTSLGGETNNGCAGGDCGTIFTLSENLQPFVEALPGSGRVGSAVKILGNNLTGTVGVTFNGVPAEFKVLSPTLILSTVPSGAMTGSIEVTTASKTLSSNVPFQVLP